MENISLSIVALRANREVAIASGQTFLNKSPDFQRTYESWNEKLKSRFVESMLLGRAMNPIWTVLNDDDESEEILDGMHRISTALAFLDNQFCMNKLYLMNLDGEKYHKKFFRDLPPDDKARIRNYNFVFNKLDSSYRKDLNKLRDMYEILNRSSRTLNDYEFNKVLFKPFYDIIAKVKPLFLRTKFFSKMKDARGSIDCEIMDMLAFSSELPNSWSSVASLRDNWLNQRLGETFESVTAYISANGEQIEARMVYLAKIISDFYQRDLFAAEPKVFKSFYLPYKLVVSRCANKFKNYACFNRHADPLIEELKLKVFNETGEDVEVEWENQSRNSTFQKQLVSIFDRIIDSHLDESDNQRLFPRALIEEKLKAQMGCCAICKKFMKEGDEFQGDHIVPWTAGGKTIIENLQVVHKRCHQLK
jgi:hypothetical protein